jgi:hypothetical protein
MIFEFCLNLNQDRKMKKITMFIVFMILTTNACFAWETFQPWNTPEVFREIFYIGISFEEMEQAKFREEKRQGQISLFLRNDASQSEIEQYFITTRLVHLGVVHLLDHEKRRMFQNFTIGLSGGTIVVNFFENF